MTNPAIPAEAVEAAAPWITNFLERRGLVLRGKEADVLAGYVLQAAAPHIRAQALEDAAATLTKPGTLWWGDKGVTVAEPPALPTMTLEEWFIAQAESERATK